MSWMGAVWACVCGGEGEGWGHLCLGPPGGPPPIPYSQGIMGGVVGIVKVKQGVRRGDGGGVLSYFSLTPCLSSSFPSLFRRFRLRSRGPGARASYLMPSSPRGP